MIEQVPFGEHYIEEPLMPPGKHIAQERFYKPELDVLRFFAFLAVFTRHALPDRADAFGNGNAGAWIASITRAGAFGVDLFFVLSAYLITSLLLREQERFGRLDVRGFYIRRVLRIWPLYFAFLALTTFIVPLVLPEQHTTWSEIGAFAVLGGNWWCAYVAFPKSAIALLWSVSIEEQFYLLWPPIVASLRSRGLVIACLVMAFLPTIVRLGLWQTQGSHMDGRWLWTATPVRLEPIALGILLALIQTDRRRIESLMLRIGLALAGLIAIVSVSRFTQIIDGSPTPAGATLGYPLVAVGCVLIVIAFDGLQLDRLPAVLRVPLIELGKRSYGLYVFHLLTLSLVREWLLPGQTSNAGKMGTVVLAFVADVGLSWLSYRWLETPFLRFKERFSRVRSRPV